MIRRLAVMLCAAALTCARAPTEIVLRIYSEADFAAGPTDTRGVTDLVITLSKNDESQVFQELHFSGRRMTFPGEIAVIRDVSSADYTLVVQARESFAYAPGLPRIDLTYRVRFTEGATTELDVVFANDCAAATTPPPTVPATNCAWAGQRTLQNHTALPPLEPLATHPSPCGLLCDGLCTDGQTRVEHCGRCGNRCIAAQSCVAGQCQCRNDEIQCPTGCLRIDSASYCGSCTRTCDIACRRNSCLVATVISVGEGHACAVLTDSTNDNVACWGSRRVGQLGAAVRTDVASSNPAPMDPPVAVAAGGQHTCSLSRTGRTVCWGDNHHSQLGRVLRDLGTGGTQWTPVPGSVDRAPLFGHLAAGRDFTCGAREQQVWCWGARALGQAGGGAEETDALVPTLVPLLGVGAIDEIVAGAAHVCVRTAGEVWCWGDNRQGQCGVGLGALDSAAPSLVIRGGVTALAAGGDHTCAIANDRLYCWGSNAFGEVGGIAMSRVRSPTMVGMTSVQQVVAGTGHTCVLTAPERGHAAVRCWGNNSNGQRGEAPSFSNLVQNEPEAVNRLSVVALAAGGDSTCALVASGNVLCWGAPLDGLEPGPRYAPHAVVW